MINWVQLGLILAVIILAWNNLRLLGKLETNLKEINNILSNKQGKEKDA